MMQTEEIVPLLHAAATRVGREMGTPPMDALAFAGAEFLQTSDLHDEDGAPVELSAAQAIGYGIMLGWLAREAANVGPGNAT